MIYGSRECSYMVAGHRQTKLLHKQNEIKTTINSKPETVVRSYPSRVCQPPQTQ